MVLPINVVSSGDLAVRRRLPQITSSSTTRRGAVGAQGRGQPDGSRHGPMRSCEITAIQARSRRVAVDERSPERRVSPPRPAHLVRAARVHVRSPAGHAIGVFIGRSGTMTASDGAARIGALFAWMRPRIGPGDAVHKYYSRSWRLVMPLLRRIDGGSWFRTQRRKVQTAAVLALHQSAPGRHSLTRPGEHDHAVVTRSRTSPASLHHRYVPVSAHVRLLVRRRGCRSR